MSAYNFKEYLPYYKRNLKVAFPVMLTQLGAALVGLADSIMVGHYGTADLAAVSFSNAIFFTVMVFAMGAMMGLTPLVGEQVGKMQKEAETPHPDEKVENRLRKIASLFVNGTLFMGILCLCSLALLLPCLPFLDSFGQEPEVIACARPYYMLIILSIVPFLCFCLLKQFLEGLGNTSVAMIITLACNLLNIFLNWVFIFGHLGCQPMGAAGAGLATLIARTLMPLCFLLVMCARPEWKTFLTRFRRSLIRRREIDSLFTIGTPIGMQTFVETFLFTASFVIIGWISKEALAAHHIANQMADLTFMLAQGIGAATTIRVSHQLGKGDLRAVRMAGRASVHLCLLLNTLGAALMYAFRYRIPYIFTDDPEVASIASSLIVFAALFQYADGLQCTGAAMLRGIQDVKVPMQIAVFAYIAVALPLGIYLTFYFPAFLPLIWGETGSTLQPLGPKGMWMAFVIALAIPAIAFHIRFAKRMKHLETSYRSHPNPDSIPTQTR